MTATTASTTCGASRWNTTVPRVVAITTCTTKAPAEPSQTAKGRPRVDITSEATMVLSGSSPTKITAKTAPMTARFTWGRSAR